MLNYGIFTQISVLQGLREKEAKIARKVVELAKVISIECRDNFNIVVTKKLKEIGKRIVTTIQTLLRQILRRIPEKTTESCRDISKVVATQYKAKGKEFVVTFQKLL